MHIQFLYGLFPLGLLFVVTLFLQILQRTGTAPGFLVPPSLSSGKLGLVFAACALATCVGPYSYHLYPVILEYSKAKLTYSLIIELQPLTFRAMNHYVEFLLCAAGFFAVGWQKKVDLFKLALLTVAALVGFRTMRDSWFVSIVAAACIADILAGYGEREKPESIAELAGVFAAVAISLLLFARGADFTKSGLDQAISHQFPVRAVNFLRKNPAPGPLYNTLDWGGFLMWYMPDYPVAIDGRNDLYGDKLDELFINTQRGEDEYKADPYLNESGVVLIRPSDGLFNALSLDPRFGLIYQDQIAAVFVRR